MTKSHRIRTVDVFAEKSLAGNQLAVVLDAADISGEAMQRIAKEMNISETTFVLPPDDPAHAARVRMFTPASELPFAGHPTVGTAWVLANEGLVPGGSLEFVLEEGVGPVKVRGVKGPGGLTFWMRHPELTFGVVERRRAQAAESIGLGESDLLEEVPVQVVSTGNPFLFFALRDGLAVDEALADPDLLSDVVKGTGAFGAFIFAVVGPNHLYSRMFSLDIPEDPATGSGSGPLGAFAVRYGLVLPAPKVTLVSEQGTKMGRQSIIHIELTYPDGDDLPSAIEVGGAVRPVITGTLLDFD
ncbi:MAG TPA: PhzF family phenazine biosynthesis protein [Candidatus Acidoferrum sp.]|nr:PhzF family phenazine biosynthesis protein [Candidatus Acidoferrum sp.]